MNTLDQILTAGPSVRVGLTLLHLFWQTALVAAAGADVPAEPPKTEWSKTVDGLQTRLFLDVARVEAGRRVMAYLDVRNVSEAPVAVARMDELGRLIHVSKRKQPGGTWVRVLPEDPMRIGRSKTTVVLGPGKRAEAWHLRLDAAFALIGEGVYRLQWPRIPAKQYVAKGRVPPPSLAVTLTITPHRGAGKAIDWLDGHAWSKPLGGLQTRLTAPARRFAAGKPIPMRVEMRNGSKHEVRSLGRGTVFFGNTVTVTDATGARLQYLLREQQPGWPGIAIAPGRRVVLCQFDLSDCYYLRRPGRYVVVMTKGDSMAGYSATPASPPFEIEIAPDPSAEADGNPIGRLMAAMPKNWVVLRGCPNASGPPVRVRRPGRYFSRVPCRTVILHRYVRHTMHAPPSVKIWLAQRRAEPEAWQPPRHVLDNVPSPTRYLGGNRHFHVYVDVSRLPTKIWPSLFSDLKKALRCDATR